MPTPQRRSGAGVIQLLLDQPYRFAFVQAVRLLERWMVQHGVPRSSVLSDYLQFQNSLSFSFPASEIEALQPDAVVDVGTEAELAAALENGQFRGIRITPAFIGFLGNQGGMPNHYSERLARWQHEQHDEGPRAFVDLFSNRLVALFYLAWRKHRLELTRTDDGADGLLPLLLSLSGGRAPTVPFEAAGFYAAAFRQRPVTAVMMQRVLGEYFAIPVQVIPNLGGWHRLTPEQSSQLGRKNSALGNGVALGPRLWRRDLKVTIRLGPLNLAQHDHFLKDAPGAAALKNMLYMFETPTLQYEVQLVLRRADVLAATLAAGGATRLGMHGVLLSGAAEVNTLASSATSATSATSLASDWHGSRYLIRIE